MISSSIAKRYARAFFEIAGEEDRYERYCGELHRFLEILVQNRDLRDFLVNPLFDLSDKKTVIEAILAKAGLSEMTGNFLRLLVDKRRIGSLPDIVSCYEQFMDDALRQVRVSVRTAFPLHEELSERLKSSLEEMTGRRVNMAVEEDRALLGGIVVRVGDTLYDGSVRTQLVNIRNLLGEER